MQKLFHLRIRFFVARLDLNYPKYLHMCIHCDKILPWVSTFIPYNLDLLVLLGSWSIKLFNNVDTVSAGLNDLWYFTWIFLVIRYFYSPWHLTYFFRKYIGHNLWIINITDSKYHKSISREFFLLLSGYLSCLPFLSRFISRQLLKEIALFTYLLITKFMFYLITLLYISIIMKHFPQVISDKHIDLSSLKKRKPRRWRSRLDRSLCKRNVEFSNPSRHRPKS